MTSKGLHRFHSLTRLMPKENVPKDFVFYAKSFVCFWEKNMSDLLYQAAIEYGKLKNIIYRIVIGRKGKAYTLMLHFPKESFFHLAGLQHLKDITFPSTNKERIYKEILKGQITIEDIKKSVFYEEWFIEERLSNLHLLQDMFNSNSITYLIHNKMYVKYTTIRADYLCVQNTEQGIIYLFSVIERKSPRYVNECRGCSFFKKHDTDYTNGTSKTTTLLIEKHINDRIETVYRNPSYKE